MSRRMGRDKALLQLGDRVMVRRVADAVGRVADEVVVVVSRHQNPEEYRRVLPPTVSLTEDAVEKQTPVVGIFSGLSQLESDYACVVSCDAPFVKPAVLDFLFKASHGIDAVIPAWPNGLIEPLHAVYRVETTRTAAKQAIEAEEFKNTDIIKRLHHVSYISVEELQQLDRELVSFFNVNTPAEYQRALVMLNEIGETG